MCGRKRHSIPELGSCHTCLGLSSVIWSQPVPRSHSAHCSARFLISLPVATMSSNLNISLDNPYGNVTIPRAKLRSSEESSTIITNPLAVDSLEQGRSSGLNPYSSFKPPGAQMQGTSQSQPGLNTSPYQVQSSYTIKEQEEDVNCCYACCCRCRRKKK
ncbi:hypothetical protein GN956_G23583 [Arapaima gigas]